MIEKKYTGVAKQGADVVANPTLDGSEQALNSIRINGENFKIEGGTEVVANETLDGSERILNSLTIDGIRYKADRNFMPYVNRKFIAELDESGYFIFNLDFVASSYYSIRVENITLGFSFFIQGRDIGNGSDISIYEDLNGEEIEDIESVLASCEIGGNFPSYIYILGDCDMIRVGDEIEITFVEDHCTPIISL